MVRSSPSVSCLVLRRLLFIFTNSGVFSCSSSIFCCSSSSCRNKDIKFTFTFTRNSSFSKTHTDSLATQIKFWKSHCTRWDLWVCKWHNVYQSFTCSSFCCLFMSSISKSLLFLWASCSSFCCLRTWSLFLFSRTFWSSGLFWGARPLCRIHQWNSMSASISTCWCHCKASFRRRLACKFMRNIWPYSVLTCRLVLDFRIKHGKHVTGKFWFPANRRLLRIKKNCIRWFLPAQEMTLKEWAETMGENLAVYFFSQLPFFCLLVSRMIAGKHTPHTENVLSHCKTSGTVTQLSENRIETSQ